MLHRSVSNLVRILLAIVVMLCARTALAEEVLIVVSSDSKPYALAAEACAAELRGSGLSSQRVLLDELDQSAVRNRTSPAVGVGASAAAKLASLLPENTRLVYCMTPDPDRLGLLSRENTSGVSTDPDIPSEIRIMQDSGLSIAKIGMLYRSGEPASLQLRDRFRDALPEDWTLVAMDLDKSSSATSGIDAMIDEGVDIVWTAADPSVYNSALVKALLLRSIREHVTVFGFSHALVRAGSPLGVGFTPQSQGTRAAQLLRNKEMGQHESSESVPAINLTALSRIDLQLSPEFMRKVDVRFGTD